MVIPFEVTAIAIVFAAGAVCGMTIMLLMIKAMFPDFRKWLEEVEAKAREETPPDAD